MRIIYYNRKMWVSPVFWRHTVCLLLLTAAVTTNANEVRDHKCTDKAELRAMLEAEVRGQRTRSVDISSTPIRQLVHQMARPYCVVLVRRVVRAQGRRGCECRVWEG